MTYSIVIEPMAEHGIRSAVRWITEEQSPSSSAKWYNGLLKKVGTLKTHPHRCPLAAENDKFAEEIRELLYGRRRNKHRLIFTIRGETVCILYVHHSARDEIDPEV